jgi:long-chain acyl-CoA synthetase
MTARHWTRSDGSIPKEIDPERYPSVTPMMAEALRRYTFAGSAQ